MPFLRLRALVSLRARKANAVSTFARVSFVTTPYSKCHSHFRALAKLAIHYNYVNSLRIAVISAA